MPVTWGEDFARRAMQLRRDADPNSPLWVSKTGKPLRTIDHYLRRIVRRAPPDTQKKFRDAGKLAHLFRHSRVAHWARVGMDIYELRDLGGWTDFEMPNRYIHAVGGKKMKRIPQPKTQTCSSCGHKSPVTYAWCPMCGEPLAQKAKEAQARVVTKRAEADSILDRLLQDDEFIEVMKAKLIEHGLVGGKD